MVYLRSPWMVVAASFWAMAASGGIATFGLYSQKLKLTLEYDQEALNTISFFKEVGGVAGIISGILYTLGGAWLGLLVSSCANLFGYMMVWLAMTHRIDRPSVPAMCIYMCIAGSSGTFTTTSVLVTSAFNFPDNQSVVLSLLDSAQGLSAAIFTLIFQAFFAKYDISSFVLLLALTPCVANFLSAFLIKKTKIRVQHYVTRSSYLFLAIGLILAIYLLGGTVLQETIRPTLRAVQWISVMFIVLLFLMPFLLVLYVERPGNIEPSLSQSLLKTQPDFISARSDPNLAEIKSHWPKYGDDFTVWQATLSLDMWLILVITGCAVSAATTTVNNLGQLGVSLDFSQKQVNAFVALLNVWDFMGGIACGMFSEIALKKHGVPRPFFLAGVVGISALGNAMIALNFKGALFISSILVGTSIGGQWAMLWTIIAELFGVENYGTLQNFVQVPRAVGNYVLSVAVAGVLYDKEAQRQKSIVCHGLSCYHTTYLILMAACMFGTLSAVVLSLRTLTFYKGLATKQR